MQIGLKFFALVAALAVAAPMVEARGRQPEEEQPVVEQSPELRSNPRDADPNAASELDRSQNIQNMPADESEGTRGTSGAGPSGPTGPASGY